MAPADAPAVVVTAVVQGPGTGGNNVKGVVADALQYVIDHQAELLGD